MIHQTFYNLPKEKKMRIFTSAVREFSNYPYAKTSINRVIQEANIPKGSFYQYFDHKDDLYIYCITKIYQQILEIRQKRKESLLDTGIGRVGRLGFAQASRLNKEEILEILGEENYAFAIHMMEAPSQVRNAALLEISTRLVLPELKKELSAHAGLKDSPYLDFYAYLLSINELVTIEYADRRGIPADQMDELAYQYLNLLYSSMLKER